MKISTDEEGVTGVQELQEARTGTSGGWSSSLAPSLPLTLTPTLLLSPRVAWRRGGWGLFDGAVKLVGGVWFDQANFGRKGNLVVRIKGQRDRGDNPLIAHLEQRIDHRI